MRAAIAALMISLSGAASGQDLLNRVIDACPSPPPISARSAPNVPFEIVEWPVELVDPLCSPDGKARYAIGYVDACAIGPDDDGAYQIYLRNDFSPFQRWCAIWHEKGHLPPNAWKH